MLESKGLLVVPSGPGLKDLGTHPKYREALLGADMAIMDSALMVMVWNFRERDSVTRISGLEYINLLLEQPEIKNSDKIFWIMAGRESADRNLAWLNSKGIHVPDHNVYIAPLYGENVEDPELVERISQTRPTHVIVTVGGGTQEPLGYYLRKNLDYVPGIHCIGAAIAFLSGDQVHIPMWADKLYLGWLFRCLSQPSRYVPRYWEARRLVPLMLRYRSSLPQTVAD
jgi:exopolysaccharide biosynthesis WecB/TagA/CpsF family protein